MKFIVLADWVIRRTWFGVPNFIEPPFSRMMAVVLFIAYPIVIIELALLYAFSPRHRNNMNFVIKNLL